MNQKIGMYSSIVNVCAVVGFALSMIVSSTYGSYLVCMFIAFSFVCMMSAFCYYSEEKNKVAGYSAAIFSAIYAVLILIVYFAQVTAVTLDPLNEQASQILNYQNFGLFFSYDLLGYGIMALATFFAGWTIEVKHGADKVLKWLLIFHGIFFIPCLIMPMLGVFHEGQDSAMTGTIALEFWCAYFIPIGVLSFLYFKSRGNIRDRKPIR